jgi:hypothetical protein
MFRRAQSRPRRFLGRFAGRELIQGAAPKPGKEAKMMRLKPSIYSAADLSGSLSKHGASERGSRRFLLSWYQKHPRREPRDDTTEGIS